MSENGRSTIAKELKKHDYFFVNDLPNALFSSRIDLKNPVDETLNLTIQSFGFKYGLPAELDLCFDVRFLKNPFYEEHLRPFTGLDLAVAEHVLSKQPAQEFLHAASGLLTHLLPLYRQQKRRALIIAVGCTGGRHRAPAVAEQLERLLAAEGFKIQVIHRDIAK